jgi:hypothetical protein
MTQGTERDAATFAEQISGARNAQVLEEFPAELSAEDEAVEPGSAEDLQSAEEALLETAIAQAENSLALLQAEKRVLALKRRQLEAKAAQEARGTDAPKAADTEATLPPTGSA